MVTTTSRSLVPQLTSGGRACALGLACLVSLQCGTAAEGENAGMPAGDDDVDGGSVGTDLITDRSSWPEKNAFWNLSKSILIRVDSISEVDTPRRRGPPPSNVVPRLQSRAKKLQI